jgi:hypothetical protein
MSHCDPSFARLLRGFDLDKLEQHGACVYGIWRDMGLAYFNAGWIRFARTNGGETAIATRWGLGSSIDEAISEPLRSYYVARYRKCLRDRTTWEHHYECSSPQTYRLLHLTAYPLGSAEGLLIVNSVVTEHPHNPAKRPVCEADDAVYVDGDGSIHQCGHCRRVQRMGPPDQWDWVPAWVEKSPQNTSHGLCPVCQDYYYRGFPEGDRRHVAALQGATA